jgi:hypothetical protein
VEKTLEGAERLRALEREIQKQVRLGKDLAELLRYDELLANKSATGGLPQMRFARKNGRHTRAITSGEHTR